MPDRSTLAFALILAAVLPVSLLHAQAKDAAPEKPKGRNVVQLTGIDAVRYFVRNSKFIDAEDYSYPILWRNWNQPELLHLLGQSLSRLNRREDAATYYRLLMRVAEESPSEESAKWKPFAEKYLTYGETDHQKRSKQYEAETGGKFTKAEAVSDLWMTQATAELRTLDELLAWKLARIEVEFDGNEPQAVHRKQGVMHRSGMKRVDEVAGRKGVLFTIPHTSAPKGPAPLDAPPMKGATRVTIPYGGKGKFLRIGTKGYLSPFTLEVSVKGATLHTQKIEAHNWADVKIELKEPPKAGEVFTLELIVERSRWPDEGVWLDYAGFFAD